jgi:hypothetical protein
MPTERTLVPMIVPVEGGEFAVWHVAVDDHLTYKCKLDPESQSWQIKFTMRMPVYRGAPIKK